MDTVLQAYQEYLGNEKRSSANTVQSYVRDAKALIAHLSELKIEKFSDVSREIITEYLDELEQAGKSQSTVIRAVASLKSFFLYLTKTGVVEESPVSKISIKKTDRKTPEILSGKEVDVLLSQPNALDMKGCRDKAMLELLYATGIRVTELVDLNVEDVNLELGFIKCNSKTKSRTIPLYPMAVKSLQSYMKEVRPYITNTNSQSALFINFSGSRLSRQGFWKIIKKYAQSAQINKCITPHTLRHSFAAHMLENGSDIRFMQEILGHSDLATTQMYAQMLSNRYRQIYIAHHPRA